MYASLVSIRFLVAVRLSFAAVRYILILVMIIDVVFWEHYRFRLAAIFDDCICTFLVKFQVFPH